MAGQVGVVRSAVAAHAEAAGGLYSGVDARVVADADILGVDRASTHAQVHVGAGEDLEQAVVENGVLEDRAVDDLQGLAGVGGAGAETSVPHGGFGVEADLAHLGVGGQAGRALFGQVGERVDAQVARRAAVDQQGADHGGRGVEGVQVGGTRVGGRHDRARLAEQAKHAGAQLKRGGAVGLKLLGRELRGAVEAVAQLRHAMVERGLGGEAGLGVELVGAVEARLGEAVVHDRSSDERDEKGHHHDDDEHGAARRRTGAGGRKKGVVARHGGKGDHPRGVMVKL